MKANQDRQCALKKSIQPQQSAYLYSSSYLFNQKRVQAKKVYAQKQQEKLKQFDDQFKLDISESISLEQEPTNRQNEAASQEQYQLVPATIQQNNEIDTILLSEQTQVDQMVKELLQLKEILKNCEKSHRVIKKTGLAEEDKEFLQQLMNQYGPPSIANKYGNLQVTLSKLIGKIELNQKNQKKQILPEKEQKKVLDGSIIHDVIRELEQDKPEQSQREDERILQNMHKQNLPDSHNFCSIGLAIDNKSRFTDKKEKSIEGNKVKNSYGLENFRKSRLMGSNNFCSIAQQHEKMYSPAPQIRKHRYSEYDELEKSQAKRSLSEKKREKKGTQNSKICLSPQEIQLDKSSKKRVQFDIQAMQKSQYPKLANNQQPAKTERLRYGSNQPTQKYRYSEHRAENQLQNIKKFPITNQFIEKDKKIPGLLQQEPRISKKQEEYYQISESPIINHQYFGTSLSENNFNFKQPSKNQLSRINSNNLIHCHEQCSKHKMQVSKINASSFVVEFNRMELEIDFNIIKKIKLMKNQIGVWSQEIGQLQLIFNQIEDYNAFYQRIVLKNRN